jgi:nucleoside-diphosphate-sugar epimerase
MSRHVLILGGHGKVSQLLTPLLLKRAWTVTSVIRTPDQIPAIEALAPPSTPGKLTVLVRSIDDVTSKDKAAALLREVKPDYVAWSAGAGGKGGPERTFAIDRDAAIHFIHAAADIPSITRFLLVSHIGSRRESAPWWQTGEWDKYVTAVNNGVLKNYYKAKIAADEELYKVSRASSTLVGIDLRPPTLTDEPAGGVKLGKTPTVNGKVSRETVAKVADAYLAAEGVKNSWVDFYDGDEDIDEAVQRFVSGGGDTAEGEPVYSS